MPNGITCIHLEFDTGTKGGALLGDIASSLVSIDELLRDLASIAAYPSSVEFRKIEIVAIELRSPLKITLSAFAISPDAVKAFQDICRDIILFRDHNGVDAQQLTSTTTEKELRRLRDHITTLQNAAVPLKRVIVKAAVE